MPIGSNFTHECLYYTTSTLLYQVPHYTNTLLLPSATLHDAQSDVLPHWSVG